MTTSTSGDRPLAAVAVQTACFTLISANDAIIKVLVVEVPSWQVMAMRSSLALLFLTPLIVYRLNQGTGHLRTSRLPMHAMRAILSAVSIFTYLEALRVLDLPVATTILFIAPFFVVALSALMLREPVPINRWIAVIIGFCGALVILQPGPTGVSTAMLLMVVSAATWGATMVMMRDLSRTESDLAVIVYFNIFLVAISASFAVPTWQPVSTTALGMIAVVAGLQLISQQLMMIAFRLAPASVVAPVQYVQLLWSVAAGWLIFGVWPAGSVWLGAAIIVASGLYLIWSERA
jgi:drug/metabolite transporter (DMT)-like permease